MCRKNDVGILKMHYYSFENVDLVVFGFKTLLLEFYNDETGKCQICGTMLVVP